MQRAHTHRTRRNWKPNAQRKRVFSELLGRMLPLSLTTHTLRCIDKAGGATRARELPRARSRASIRRSLPVGFVCGFADARCGTPLPRRAGLDAYVLNARTAELGTGVGPRLRAELLLATQLRKLQGQFEEERDAAKAAARAALPAAP